MTPADLAAARWFRAKHRAVATVTPIDSAAVGPADLVIVEVGYADGNGSDRYLLVTVHAREPEDGEGAWAAIVDAMARNATVPAVRGAFEARHTPALTRLLERPPTAERRLRVEQSNTSVRIGKRLLLKLYRLLEAGPNPDLELTAFLTEAGVADTPALAGWLTWRPDEGEPAAAAMLQSYVPSTGDAWAAMLEALARDPREGVALAGQLGQLTRRLHDALASRPSDVFPARTATVAETGAWRASAERQLAQAVSAVAGDAHRDLVALAPNVRARFADTFGSSPGEARVSRIHGDLHLGQLLARADGGFAVIDFEGEPARPLAERR